MQLVHLTIYPYNESSAPRSAGRSVRGDVQSALRSFFFVYWQLFVKVWV